MAERDEDALIRDCLRDDPGAWDEFIRRYGGTARISVMAALGRYGLGAQMHAAGEIVQKVFCEIWEKKKLADLRDTRQLRPYVASLAACRAIDETRVFLRSKERRAELGEDNPDGPPQELRDGGPDPRRIAHRAEMHQLIGREIEDLPYKEAFMLRLSTEEGMTHQAIADLMGLPRDTVSSVIRRCRDKIRKSLELKGFTDS